ncbi:PP2C family protein-serine/threonine phosphatase [Labilibacter marinus]|uniref:PP2C family protein-serine/threonine phosphatase n=1 Tax=Labilibacter marinus TaxID=1477105 RepID=UPI0008335221|nr:SpoIIE family protein phosphatase [Labilibacter marinus]
MVQLSHGTQSTNNTNNMSSSRIPKFIGLRIYFTSTILYLFLVMPFIGFLFFQNLPEIMKGSKIARELMREEADSQVSSLDSSRIHLEEGMEEDELGSLEEQYVQMADSIAASVEHRVEKRGSKKKGIRNKHLSIFLGWYFKSLLLCYLLGLAFNRPFKIYLRRKRKQKHIGDRLQWYCKKFILQTPLINGLILTLPHIASHAFALLILMSENPVKNGVEDDNFLNFFYVSAVAAFLTILFVYFWQKNRVRLKYIEFFYSKEELKKRIFRFRSGKIGRQLWFANALTTFFPLAIVGLYIVLSLSSIESLGLSELSLDQRKVLLGDWNDSIDMILGEIDIANQQNFYYVNAIDTVIMFIGIGTGILISIIYIFLILKWTTHSIVDPVRELLLNMKKIRSDGITDFTIVRTNDEVGELAEGFNVMIQKIKNYIASISKMNAELEDKVIERTREIEKQKEEIEDQKEEIVTQLELVISQKDTIEAQKQQILDSIHYAKRIQTAIMPPEDLLQDSFCDHFVLNNPRDIVSGDFYWNVKKDNKLYIAVADCTGHGVPGAFLSILGISYLNEIVSANDYDASQILGRLRESLIFSLHQKGKEGEAQDGLEIALCILDLNNNTLQYAGANRPLYLFRKNSDDKNNVEPEQDYMQVIPNGDYRMLKYRPDSMPIGIYYDATSPFTNIDIPIQPGDSFYLFTDGYVDQLGGPKRKTFRVKYLRELLFGIQEKKMSEQREVLQENIKQWQGDLMQTDDILVLGVKIGPDK